MALIALLPTTTIYTQWSSTSAKDLKQPVNFFGEVITHQGQELKVDNISVNGKYAKISMPLKPENLPAAELNSETKKYEVKLSENPNTEFIKRDVDLEETSEIKVPSPDTIYVYQKKEKSQRIEFLEVEVISKSNTKYFFLLETRTPIYCDGVDNAGPQETTIPLSALKSLTIKGFTYRDTSIDKNKKCKPNSCPPCKAEKQE